MGTHGCIVAIMAILLLMCIPSSLTASRSSVPSSVSAPNFVILLADDLGYGDVGYAGGITRTKHLDAMAADNNTIVFRNMHSGGTVCSPTRSSILTGRVGARDCISSALGCASQDALTCSETGALNNTLFTVAHAAAMAGAESQFYGKFHLGNFLPKPRGPFAGYISNPGTHGFDNWMATISCAPTMTPNCRCNHSWVKRHECLGGHYPHKSIDDGPPWCANYWEQQHEQESGMNNDTTSSAVQNYTSLIKDDSAFIVDQFERFLQTRSIPVVGEMQQAPPPFVALLFFHAVHIPFIASPEWRKKCENGTACRTPSPPAASFTPAQLDYYGSLAMLDAQVGRVRALLRSHGLSNNTMLLFMSDNGPEGIDCGPSGCPSSDPGSTGGLRGRKRDTWEGGHRVPGLLEYPAMLHGRAVGGWDGGIDTLVSSVDILPTIMDAYNISIRDTFHPDWIIDGESLLPLLHSMGAPVIPITDDHTLDGANNSNSIMHSIIGSTTNTPNWTRTKPLAWLWPSINNTLSTGWLAPEGDWKLVINSRTCNTSALAPPSDSCAPKLYNLLDDAYEKNDTKEVYPETFAWANASLTQWLVSVCHSQLQETGCGWIKSSGYCQGLL